MYSPKVTVLQVRQEGKKEKNFVYVLVEEGGREGGGEEASRQFQPHTVHDYIITIPSFKKGAFPILFSLTIHLRTALFLRMLNTLIFLSSTVHLKNVVK